MRFVLSIPLKIERVNHNFRYAIAVLVMILMHQVFLAVEVSIIWHHSTSEILQIVKKYEL